MGRIDGWYEREKRYVVEEYKERKIWDGNFVEILIYCGRVVGCEYGVIVGIY